MKLPNLLPLLGLDGISLKHGSHLRREQGVCVMEAVAWIAGEQHSDEPKCACPVVSSFMRCWNDGLPDNTERDRLLKPLVPLLVNSKRNQAVEAKRSRMAYDWYLTVYTPSWFELANLKDYAKAIRANPTSENLQVAKVAARSLQADSSGPTAHSAFAAAAAGYAAEQAAAAGYAAAAVPALHAAANPKSTAYLLGVAWSLAWSLAWSAARAARRSQGVAEAGPEAIKSTIEKLQESAQDLVRKMLKVKQ